MFFDQLRSISGTNAKLQFLQSASELDKAIMVYTYDPFRNYYIRKANIVGNALGMINEETFRMLDSFDSRAMSGNAAIKLLEDHARTLLPSQANILRHIIKRNLDIGIGAKSINKVFSNLIPEFGCMLANKVRWSKVRYPYYASPKLDGIRGLCINGKMLSRTGKPIKGVEHIEKAVRELGMDLDGELLIPGQHFQDSSGKLRSHNTTVDAKYYVFDTPDTNARFSDRLNRIAKLKGASNLIKIVKHKIVRSSDEIHNFYNLCLDKGLEGLVLKEPDHYYKRSRSNLWMKMKEVNTIDVRVIDFKEGEDRLTGMLGALIVELNNGVKARVGSGFTDKMRKSMWNNRTGKNSMYGRIIEIEFHERTKDGSLRHARYIKTRPDKSTLI